MKSRRWITTLTGQLLIAWIGCRPGPAPEQNWTHYVRIGGHGLSRDRVDNIIESATDTYVFGIEVDNSLTGYYESFLDPEAKLEAIRSAAEAAHEAGNFAFIYTEGLETITTGAAAKEHTFYKDHPDWVQRKITGEPAVFGGGSAFWIGEEDEDVWISPYAREWREIYMERIRQIASTGIDGVYVDIPYWMTHFDGWEDSWASFDDYTVTAFKEQTGLDAKRDIRLGDYRDPGFIQWINFRVKTITDFMAEVDRNVKAVSPNCMTIAEIYPGLGESAVRVGSDVYELYEVVDVIAHEYSAGGYMATSRSPAHWVEYMAGMFTFRAFAQGKASWMLSYSWDGEENVEPSDAMEMLALSQVMAGTNPWDARGHVMSRSNDFNARREIFKWISEHENTFFRPRNPITPIGIYFSPTTRNYFPNEYIMAYFGNLFQLFHTHTEFQIVTPRTLAGFKGTALILPDMKCVSDEEVDHFARLVSSGTALVITGEAGTYNELRHRRGVNPIHQLLGINHPSERLVSMGGVGFIYDPNPRGLVYYKEIGAQYNINAEKGHFEDAPFYQSSRALVEEIFKVSGLEPSVNVETSPFIVSQIAKVDGNSHVFLANFTGIIAKEEVIPKPVRAVKVFFEGSQRAKVFVLPYLGEVEELPVHWQDGKVTAVIPEVRSGAVVWLEE